MSTHEDDDALSWDGDDDARVTPRAPRERSARTPAASPATDGAPAALGAQSDREAPGADRSDAQAGPEAADAGAPMGNAALVGFGVLAGVYALYVVGWALGGFRLRDRIEGATGAVADVMFQGALWLAILSPVIWFLVTMHATRRSRMWQRFAFLAAGMVLLVPWPFVMVGVIGQ